MLDDAPLPFRNETVPARSVALVVVQLAAIAVVAWPWRAAAFHPLGLPLLVLAVALGAWTLTANRPGNFSVFPEPCANAELVTGGPYRHVRHPMYLAVLLAAAGCALGWRTWVHAAAFAVLAIVLHVKAGIEERALLLRFPGYADYAARTPRIVPFLR